MTDNDRGPMRFRRWVDQAGWAMVSHLLAVDPNLSDGALRLYIVLLRYAQQGGECWPGVTRLAADLHISERAVKMRLKELVDRGLITRERRFGRSTVTWIEDLAHVYQAEPEPNNEAENDLIERPFEWAKSCPTEAEHAFEWAKSCPSSGAKSCPTEEEEEKKKKMPASSSATATATATEEEQEAFELLMSLPHMDAGTAKRVLERCRLEDVAGWVAEAQRAKPEVAAALVTRRLLDGIPPPGRPGNGDGDRRRYIMGEYADLIQH